MPMPLSRTVGVRLLIGDDVDLIIRAAHADVRVRQGRDSFNLSIASDALEMISRRKISRLGVPMELIIRSSRRLIPP